ncbi:MAG: alpha/beta hydrolase [Kurthia sp.]|nr:alpha/beta hydrolase [Candidatus Kurthia equi]
MKKWKWITGSAVLLCIILYFVIGNFFYNLALNPHASKDFLNDSDNLQPSELISDDSREKYYALDDAFEATHKPSEVFIESKDGLTLQALRYKQKKETHKWVVNVHFYLGDNTRMIPWTRNFYDAGFHVLAPNLRGHGSSEGDYIGMGWDDRLDLVQWIDAIIEEDPEAEILLFGISMGGSAVMMASGEELPPQVKVIIEDCGYANVDNLFAYQLKELFHLPSFPVMNAANTMTKIRAGYALEDVDAIKQLKKNTLPILFIQGDADTFVPFSMLDSLYEATAGEKEKYVVAHAGHAESESMNPPAYWDKIWTFSTPYFTK